MYLTDHAKLLHNSEIHWSDMQLSNVYAISSFILAKKYFLHIWKIKRKNKLFQLSDYLILCLQARPLRFLKKNLDNSWISIPIAQHELLINSSQSDSMATMHLSVQQCNNPDQWFQQMQHEWWQHTVPAAAHTCCCLPSHTKLLLAALRNQTEGQMCCSATLD